VFSTAVFAYDQDLIDDANRESEAKPKRKSKPVPKEQPKREKKEQHRKKHEVKVAQMSEQQIQEQIAKIDADMVKLPNGSWMGKYEVTQAQWQAVMGNNPSHFKGENLPVESVSWDDVQGYIQKLNEKTGQSYRLPTEEEWFTACQAGKSTEYCGSNNVDEVAWYNGNSGNTTHSVGQKKPNAWGLYDISGNVWEWTSSFYNNEQTQRVVRGGSWDILPEGLRSALRFNIAPNFRSFYLGFRLSR